MEQNFSMLIEDVFYQYGIFVVGRIQSGHIKVCDKLSVVGKNDRMDNLCISLQKYLPSDKTQKASVNEAGMDDYVCVGLLQGSKLQIRKGMKLVSRIED